MKPSRILIMTAILVVLLACNIPAQILAPAAEPTALPATSTVTVPTPTALPLYQSVTLGTIDFEESSTAPVYTLKTHTPVLQGSDDPRVQQFNASMVAAVQNAVDDFKKNMSEMPATPIAAGSFIEVSYKLVSAPGNILSLQLIQDIYIDGAAHPAQVTSSYTYDLEKGQEITLDQLFVPGSDYLKVIADYCIAELSTRDIGFDSTWAEGAKPTPENYAVWNISPDGLLIYFNEYQVAAYAAGPQQVTIPYASLAAILSADGPLAMYK
jgi:hypothetical protein